MSSPTKWSFKFNNSGQSNFLCNAICSKEDQAIEKKRTFYNRILLVFFIFACIILIVSVGVYVGQTNDNYSITSSIVGLVIGGIGVLIFIGLFVYNNKRDSIYRKFYSDINDITNVRDLKTKIINNIQEQKIIKSELDSINKKISILNPSSISIFNRKNNANVEPVNGKELTKNRYGPIQKKLDEYTTIKTEKESKIISLSKELTKDEEKLAEYKNVNKLYNDIKNSKNSMVNYLNDLSDDMSIEKYEKINAYCDQIQDQINYVDANNAINTVNDVLISDEKQIFKRNLDTVNSICKIITLLKDYIYTKDKKETTLNSGNILAFYVRKERFKELKTEIIKINEGKNLQVNFLTIINAIKSTIDSFDDFILEQLEEIEKEILNIQDPQTTSDNTNKDVRQTQIRKIEEEIALQKNNISEYLKIQEYSDINNIYDALNKLIQIKKNNGEIDTLTSVKNTITDNITIIRKKLFHLFK